MNKYKCPKCNAEFELGTKFCQNCGCNLEVEFIEIPTCPKCEKTFLTGTKFCSEDGAKLVSPDKLIPRCIKCGCEYPETTKFCPEDGGQVIPEALRKGNTSGNRIKIGKSIYGKFVLGLGIIIAIIDAYIVLQYFAAPEWARQFVGGAGNAFPLYLKHEVLGWILFALVLSAITYFINGLLLETLDKEDQYSKIGATITHYAGGLAAVFLLLALLSKVITGY